MKKHFIVRIPEVHYQNVLVEAENPEEAGKIAQVHGGKAMPPLLPLASYEFVAAYRLGEAFDPSAWPVSETRDLYDPITLDELEAHVKATADALRNIPEALVVGDRMEEFVVNLRGLLLVTGEFIRQTKGY